MLHVAAEFAADGEEAAEDCFKRSSFSRFISSSDLTVTLSRSSDSKFKNKYV